MTRPEQARTCDGGLVRAVSADASRNGIGLAHEATPTADDDPGRDARIAVREALLGQSAIAHVTAHDLRTPLNTMSGLVHLLQSRFSAEFPDKALEYINYMARAVGQMDAITADFLTQMRAGPAAADVRPVDLRRCLDAVLASQVSPAIDGRINISGTGGAVLADPDLLHLLLSHLIRNACQHPHSDRPLSVSVLLSQSGGDGHSIRISDTGTGFDPGLRHAIFLPGPTGGGPDRPRRMGLAICKEVCRSHGWQISAQSDGQSGARFDIDLSGSV